MSELPGQRELLCVCVRACVSEQERKGQQYTWGTSRGQVYYVGSKNSLVLNSLSQFSFP